MVFFTLPEFWLPLLVVLVSSGVLAFVARAWFWTSRIPEVFPRTRRRELILIFVVLSSQVVPLLGLLPPLAVYVIRVFSNFGQRKGPAPSDEIPVIPRVTLMEMLGMVVSVSVFPLTQQHGFVAQLFRAPHLEPFAHLFYYVNAFAVFPLCFACALYRLESIRVPAGWNRTLFLAVFPYSLLAIVWIPQALLFCAFEVVLDREFWMDSGSTVNLACSVLWLLVGLLLSIRVGRSMPADTSRLPPKSPSESPLPDGNSQPVRTNLNFDVT